MTTGTDDVYSTRRSQVEAMAGLGVPAADIARVLGIELDLLHATYAHELECAHIKAIARVPRVCTVRRSAAHPIYLAGISKEVLTSASAGQSKSGADTSRGR